MEQKDIERINALARKARGPQGLSDAERQEQAALRRAYIEAVKARLNRELDRTYWLDNQGRKHKLKRKGAL